jgi:restriction system protein
MGFVKSELAESTQNVRGMSIAHEDDLKIRRALSITQNIEFYTYKIDFKLQKK